MERGPIVHVCSEKDGPIGQKVIHDVLPTLGVAKQPRIRKLPFEECGVFCQ